MLTEKDSTAYSLAAGLDDFLGDPMVPGRPYSYREIVEAEESSKFPEGARELIMEWGFHQFLVPTGLGGRLHSLDELFMVCRTLARRNVGIAVSYGSALLGACPVWLWGNTSQRDAVARELLDGGLACFAVSETDHGSDLRASETVLDRDGDVLRLTGSKWPIGNATCGRFVTILVKSGPQECSLVLVDKEHLPTDRWSALPPIRTVGLRGHDLSGIEFRAAPLTEGHFIGQAGLGITQVLKTMQITRTAVTALSLGTMDAVLRIALAHVLERRLYGNDVFSLPVIRERLIDGHVDLFISECTALPISRALTLAPERMSVWSAVVKYTVPAIAEETVSGMAAVLGARSYLREGLADGAFQKLQRDHAVTSIFDGTAQVNLHSIAVQLPALARRIDDFTEESVDALVRLLFDPTQPTPTWIPDGRCLRNSNGGLDEITQSWPLAVRRLEELAANPHVTPVAVELLTVCRGLDGIREVFYDRIRRDTSWQPTSIRAHRDAITHCLLHAATSCVWMWLHNRARAAAHFADGGWLLLCLQRVMKRLGCGAEEASAHRSALAEQMVAAASSGRGMSLVTLAPL